VHDPVVIVSLLSSVSSPGLAVRTDSFYMMLGFGGMGLMYYLIMLVASCCCIVFMGTSLQTAACFISRNGFHLIYSFTDF
jgi:uncharacterized membrane protein